jgi:predicted lipoprotein with Yx(FWY)xxD motif
MRAKPLSLLMVAGLLALAGCGDDDDDGASEPKQPAQTAESQVEQQKEQEPPEPTATGTAVKLDDSEFGQMLFGENGQAIYTFENDSKGKTVCYDDCAEAWPPVFTGGQPKAGKGVEASLLGTVKRRDGRSQVTYAGQPLYYSAHEGPGEVRCHNVDLNGGFWWAVGADGKRLPS